MEIVKEIARMEEELKKLRETKLKIWNSGTERNARRTLVGLDACNARIYELGIKLREAKRREVEEYGKSVLDNARY